MSRLGINIPPRDMSVYKIINTKKVLTSKQPQPDYNYTVYDPREELINMNKQIINGEINNGLVNKPAKRKNPY